MSSTLIRGQATLDAPGIAQTLGLNPRMSPYGAHADGTSDDSAAINAAIVAANAAGSGTVLLPAGTYAIAASTLTLLSNVTIRGMGRACTTLKLTGATLTIFEALTTISRVSIEDLTLDGNSIGAGITILGQANDDITVRGCRIKNGVQNALLQGATGVNLGWPVTIGSTGGANSTNVTFTHNIVGPNVPFLESCIFTNVGDSTIAHNVFRDASGNTAATGLALYAYCRNVAVSANLFENNGIDCYVQQSDSITFTGNTFSRQASGVSLDIYNCRNITITGPTFKTTSAGCVGIRIFDQLDQGLATFNGHTSQYAFSKDITIGPASFAGYTIPVQCYSPVMTSTQVAVNLMQDIDIHDCLWDNDLGTAALYGVQIGCAYTQDMRRIMVRNCHHAGGNYSGGGGVLVQGNPGVTATTTTQAVTANAAKQTVTVASTTGIVAGMWLHVDDGSHGTAEEVYVYAIPVAGQITAIFAQTHTSGAAVANSTTLVNSGLTDVPISGYKVQPSSTGNSSGVILWSTPQSCNVDIIGCDLTNAGTGTGGKVVLIGTGAYRTARDNQGFNPVIAPTGFGTALPTTPTTATFYQNTSGVLADVQVKQAGVTGTHLYVNSTASTTGALDYGAATAWPGVLFVPAGSYLRADFSAGTVTLLWQGT